MTGLWVAASLTAVAAVLLGFAARQKTEKATPAAWLAMAAGFPVALAAAEAWAWWLSTGGPR